MKGGRDPHATIVELQVHDNLSPQTNAGVGLNESGHSSLEKKPFLPPSDRWYLSLAGGSPNAWDKDLKTKLDRENF